VRMVLHLKTEQPMRVNVLLGRFGWIGSTYAANAFIAALLYLAARQAGAIVLLAAGPMIALLLSTLHFHFRQREAEAAEAAARIEHAEREAAQAARHNAELRRVAEHAGMSSVVNRQRFLECLADAFGADPRTQRRVAVMAVSFDRFRLINDTLGRAAGDEFLVHAANRIQRRVRQSEVVARLADNEFAVLVKDLEHDRVTAVAWRLLEALAKPFAVAGVRVESTASIGITYNDDGYEAPDDMLRDADGAKGQAQSLGGGQYMVHRPDVLQRTTVPDRNALEDA
jgi:diguanylate cyclase (GGDEF)-like protein